ncbi:uncharacterized protein BJ212DRAFT_1585310 [Suillus subaureus]|uniref:DUF6534 domain-containing protein n=1 Tax=Suillus subaureus TaxID=48587 RepID=A0A9P7JHA0_9AGAM|nr:uncharacterized protein BJ212DRAFT_1585310 [Suillus subaureus]KAG1822494.1 hypothetical protein BJ212DRAFT_1585310 [Suillus subaureus]
MSSSVQDLIPQLDIGRTFGALFIAVAIAAVFVNDLLHMQPKLLFGLCSSQAFIYFQTHSVTGMTLYKLAVIWLWILDALHLALIVHCIYYYLVINYANIGALTEIVWSFKVQIIFEVFIVYGVNLLYAYRIWILGKGQSRTLRLPITVGIIIFLNSGVAIGNCLNDALPLFGPSTRSANIEWTTFMTLGAIAFTDIVIASSLCYLLATSRTGFSSTDSLITKLMAYIINTGCLTSICSMAAIITCAVMPTNFTFLAIEFLLAKLYVNSFLALLNARYYTQVNTDTSNSHPLRNRHGVYRPELRVRPSDDELQASRRDALKHPDDEAVHPSRFIKPQQSIAVITEMDSFSSV